MLISGNYGRLTIAKTFKKEKIKEINYYSLDKFYFGKWKWKWLLASIACRGRSKEVVGRDEQFSRAFRYKIIARLGSKCWIIKASTLNRTSWHVWLGELTVSTRSVGDMMACLLANLPYPPRKELSNLTRFDLPCYLYSFISRDSVLAIVLSLH